MDTNITLPSGRASGRARPGFVARLVARLKRTLSAVNAHCQSVEEAKEACERENLQKHGKDWVNRCCG